MWGRTAACHLDVRVIDEGEVIIKALTPVLPAKKGRTRVLPQQSR